MFNQFKSNNLKSEPKLFYETIKNSLEYYDDYRFKNILTISRDVLFI